MIEVKKIFFVFVYVTICSVCETVFENGDLELSPAWSITHRYVNESYRVTCRAFKNYKDLKWIKPNGRVIIEKETGVRIQKIQYGIVLIFENVAKNAEGDYKCIAEDDIIQEISFTLNVEAPVTFISSTVFEAILNENVFLECKVNEKSTPERYWEFGGNILTEGERYEHQMEGLMIRNVGLENAGKYYCVISHSPFQTNRNRQEITLIVYTKPIFKRAGGEDITEYGFVGEISFLYCAVNAIPTARFIWYNRYENALNPRNDNVSIINEDNISILKVFVVNVRRDFICEACNELGCVNQTFILKLTPMLKTPELGLWNLDSDSVEFYVSFQPEARYYIFEYYYFLYVNQWKHPYNYNFSVGIRKPSLGNYMRFNITNLIADTKYVIRVAAGNEYTRSEFSQERKFKTKFGRTGDVICCATNNQKYNFILLILIFMNFVL